MRKYLLAVLLLALLASGTLAAPGNDDPLAEAGLDQTVDRGSTAYLDASGSHDPDGEVTAVEWTIHRPNGTTTAPACSTCARTTFEPHDTGTYRATVRVTDDDGATATDTMYLTVDPGDPPDVHATGPDVATTGNTVEYRASATAGTAALDTLTWYVDGDAVETTPASGDAATDTLQVTFDEPGSHTVRVVATDRDDQQDDARARTDAVADGDTSSTATTLPPGDPAPDPVLHGPRVVTGDEPLQGTYTVSNATSPAIHVDGTRTLDPGTVTLSPGVHEVFATADGEVTHFPDGGTTVVADPEPTITRTNISGTSALTISTRATDDLGNLRSLTIRIDGRTVHRQTLSVLDYVDQGGDSIDATYRSERLTPGEHTITVTATDGRNQTASATRIVEIPEPPEIVDAYFVDPRDDDRMAYHQRLSAEKYTAHHVLEVELNDFEPEEVEVEASAAVTEVLKVNESQYQTKYEYDRKAGRLTVHTYWASDIPKRGVVSHSLNWPNKQIVQKGVESAFWVEPSDPVIRYTIDHDGITQHHSNWGILINASNSFDPDNTGLDYFWEDGATPVSYSDSVGKADSFDGVVLRIQDGNKGQNNTSFGFLDHYVPNFENVSEVSSGPYRSDETVEFRVESELITLTKESYELNLDIGLRVDGPGRVVSWEKNRVLLTEGGQRGEGVRYTGTVEIPADAVRGDVSLELFNEKGSGWNEVRTPVPEVSGVQRGAGTVRDEKLLDVEYLVERPVYDQVRTTDSREKRQLMGDGYLVTDEERVGTTYVIEERHLVEPAVYETERMEFQRDGYLEAFLSTNPEWSEGGAETKWETRTRTEHEWRDAKSGTGTFTGETRRVLVEPAEYQTYRQYEYQRQVEKTGTRTVTRYRTFRTSVEVEETVTKCNSFFGCYEATVTRTEWRTHRVPYTATETYTYTVTETETYWGLHKRGWSHDFTGETRQIKIHDAKYETQYRYAYEETYRDRVTVYTATRERLVEPAEYEWTAVDRTSDVLDATGLATNPDRRVRSTSPIRKWTLQKRQGIDQTWVSNVTDQDDVVKTRYEVQQTRRITFVDESGVVVESRIVNNTTTRTYPGHQPPDR